MTESSLHLESPDRDGFVWICSSQGRTDWCHNLGSVEQVSEVLSRFLASIDRDENC
jgi:hypothetical protein